MASMGLSIDEQKAVDRFRKDVVEPSMTKLVILDFWAEWCGPCKALTPVLEKVVAEYADKGVVLAKVNVDEEQFIAAQFQVRSIPTVYAMFQGQPVADLTNARSESQLKAMLDQLLEQGTPIDAIGLQCHLAPGNLDMEAFLQLVEQIRQRGLPIYITELDVNDQIFADDIAERDQQVAGVYSDFLQEMLQQPGIEIIQTWQLSDKYSFYQGRQERQVRVLPFDREMQAKPAYHAVAQALAIQGND
mgnify:CR=1 FL=1